MRQGEIELPCQGTCEKVTKHTLTWDPTVHVIHVAKHKRKCNDCGHEELKRTPELDWRALMRRTNIKGIH